MRVFLTGATGFIGARIVPELQARGHQVIGMTRSETGAAALRAAGAEVHMATLEDPASVAAGAERADAVIHTAFDHNFENFVANCEKDGRVLQALGDALKGSDRPLLITSGTGIGDPGDGTPAREDVTDLHYPIPRVISEVVANRLLDAGVNVAVMRLPQVHDTQRQGLISPYIEIARQQGAVAMPGDGMNRWAAAHVDDVAALYAMAFDRGVPGARYHAVAEEGVRICDIAEVIAERLNLPLIKLAPEDIDAHFGWMAGIVGIDMPASSARTRAELGWTPQGPDLLSDLAAMDYGTPAAQ
ncbi:NAD-dependent dehydratase [Thioclava dalianensis]|uniref:NAD-dependent dehydratase n=1 Tax=Thioclava dalianensis TaxID=1185766 RepID=A0A074U613_9RHOB|nr:SDR family oxidoreductase [Thioclava dalianensis]KEP70092.1 NAD-dependent dehydratase [Thioclava dalianensis]SFN51357.1 Nucleoside-diphosphate-sugar epimerase [Thioclava dalianensis]